MMSAWRAFFERLMSRQHRSRKEKGTELPSTAQEPDSFRDFAVSASDWTWEIGADFRFIHISDKFPEITGIAKEDILGKTREELGADLIEPEALARYLDDLNNHRPFKNFEYALQSMQGCTLYASVSGIPVFDEQGGFMGYRGTGTDITGMKRLQLGLIRTARLYKTISATAAAVVRARSEQELLSELCRLSVEVGGYRRVSVGLSEDAEQDGMRLVAAHGEELTPLDLTERFVGPAGLGDSAHEAVRTGQPCVVRSDAC
ncbi:MAG: PAS domain-containing protein, partial [Hylemonella sp.]|nr:PAS domain-containing protein [Hylemonella sp.]